MKLNFQGASRISMSVLAFFLAGGIFFAGYQVGTGAQEETYEPYPAVGTEEADYNFSPFWKTWKILQERFVSASSTQAVSGQDMVWGAIEGLAASYDDPYTVFLPPRENEIFNTTISGSFSGVGMEVGMREGILTVIAPLKDTPAYRAGIQPGDLVVEIDGQITQGMTVDEAVEKIRGEKGTTVELTLIREGVDEPLEIDVVRDTISIPTLDNYIRDDGVYVIELYNFTAPSPLEFRRALRSFVQSGSNKLILDLRGNPGGYLEAAVDMASFFLPAGKVVVTEDFGDSDKNNIHRSKGYDIFSANDIDMVVLVNGGSASASEILAGALREHGVALLVGSQTFGKGSVQELVPITRDTSLKVTVARWLTPDGHSISNGGLTPDVVVDRTLVDVETGTDPQLDEAVEILLGE